VDVSFVPISLVVAIQANSVAEQVLPKIKKIGSLLTGEITGEHGEVAILAFDHRIQTLQDFTSDTAKVEMALQKLKAGSSSSRMLDAVVAGARMLNKRPQDRRKVLLVIGETRDSGSAVKVREVLTDLQFANISVYSININRLVNTLMGTAPDPRPNPLPPGAQSLPAGIPNVPSYADQASGSSLNTTNFVPLFVEIFKEAKGIYVQNPTKTMTRFTAGEEFTFANQRELERAAAKIGDELHSEYLITYNPNNKTEGGYHTIKVEVVNRPDLEVRTRPGYWVAAQPGD
jgi:VWFA-related protein